MLLTHGDSVETVGAELEVVGRSGSVVAAVQHKTKHIYGLQFHPEVELSLQGKAMLKNFLYSVSLCRLYTPRGGRPQPLWAGSLRC